VLFRLRKNANEDKDTYGSHPPSRTYPITCVEPITEIYVKKDDVKKDGKSRNHAVAVAKWPTFKTTEPVRNTLVKVQRFAHNFKSSMQKRLQYGPPRGLRASESHTSHKVKQNPSKGANRGAQLSPETQQHHNRCREVPEKNTRRGDKSLKGMQGREMELGSLNSFEVTVTIAQGRGPARGTI
jgi:hypothetical protein